MPKNREAYTDNRTTNLEIALDEFLKFEIAKLGKDARPQALAEILCDFMVSALEKSKVDIETRQRAIDLFFGNIKEEENWVHELRTKYSPHPPDARAAARAHRAREISKAHRERKAEKARKTR